MWLGGSSITANRSHHKIISRTYHTVLGLHRMHIDKEESGGDVYTRIAATQPGVLVVVVVVVVVFNSNSIHAVLW